MKDGAGGGLKGMRVGRRDDRDAFNAVDEALRGGGEFDCVAPAKIFEDAEVRVAMAGDDAVSPTAGHGGIRQVSGSSAQIADVVAFEDK
jgi:hypothetical protein